MIELLLALEGEPFAGVHIDEDQTTDIVGVGHLAPRFAFHVDRPDLIAAFGLGQPKVLILEVRPDPHSGITRCSRTALVVVIEGVGQADLLVREHPVILWVGSEIPVRRLVMAHQEERLLAVPGRHPVQALVCDDVGHIAGLARRAVRPDEHRVKIISLPGQDRPIVEPRGLVSRPFAQVPLAHHPRLIARITKQFCRGCRIRHQPAPVTRSLPVKGHGAQPGLVAI